MTIRIRPATPDDAAGIARVRVEGGRAAYRGLVPRRVLDALPSEASAEVIPPATASGPSVLVAEADGGIAGFARWGPVRSARGDAIDATAELYDLYVLPERLGSGLGASLMRAVLEQMRKRGHRVAVLWVLRGNMRARGFYEGGGWTADGAERMSETARLPSVRYRRPIG